MGNDVSLRSFPTTASEALAMLYLQNQDLSGKTPAEIATMFYEAKKEIQRDHKEKLNNGYFSNRD